MSATVDANDDNKSVIANLVGIMVSSMQSQSTNVVVGLTVFDN